MQDFKSENLKPSKTPQENTDYKSENERRKLAVEKENAFLKEEVIDHGSNAELDHQNLQTNIEKSI